MQTRLFYHSWIYEHILNTAWFVRYATWTLFLFNFVLPVVIWYTMSSRNPFRREKNETGTAEESGGDKTPADKNAKNPPSGGSKTGTQPG